MGSIVGWALWLLAFAAVVALMAGAWSGPHHAVSNLSRWAVRFGAPHIPDWLLRRDIDRTVFRSGLGALVALLAIGVFALSGSPTSTTPPTAEQSAPSKPDEIARPERQVDDGLKTAILVHVPKSKKIRIVKPSGDNEADQFAWQVDSFLRGEGYEVISPHLIFMMRAGGEPPVGTSIYQDEKDAGIFVIRVGANDRK